MKQTRREFLHQSLAGVAGASLTAHTLRVNAAQTSSQSTVPMPLRTLGKTGQKVSLLGLGGYHIGVGSDQQGIRVIQQAIDQGVTFMDNAWEYHNGGSEERLGRALQGEGRRDKVYLMTKHHGRDKKTALTHLEDSLKRLKTDVIDLWMFHECVYEEDPDRIFSRGGGIEAVEVARSQGKVRHIGFTGHKDPMIHLKMLAYGFPWDAVLMPLNILDGSFKSFETWVLPTLVRRGIAPLAMKTMASGAILKAGVATAEECWRYAAGLPVSTIVSGMDSPEILQANLKLARESQPMDEEERKAIRRRTREVALSGKLEQFKTTRNFDGPVGRKLYGVRG